jgi:hypothetical protein
MDEVDETDETDETDEMDEEGTMGEGPLPGDPCIFDQWWSNFDRCSNWSKKLLLHIRKNKFRGGGCWG